MALRIKDLPLSLRKRIPKHLLADSPKAASGKIKRSPDDELSRQMFRFHCEANGLPPAEEDYLFAARQQRLFEADFCFVDYQLIVEINGGVWKKGGGAHSRPANIIRDMNKLRYAALNGFFLISFTPEEVTKGEAVNWTMDVLGKLGWRPR